jgi:hypothetical protein
MGNAGKEGGANSLRQEVRREAERMTKRQKQVLLN